MAMITYDDKETLNSQPSIADKNKVTANDMNEIKNCINTKIGDPLNLATTDKNSLVDGINENSCEITVGTNNNLKYIIRKYGNGIMVQDLEYDTSSAVSSAWGSLYISAEITIPDFPVSFIDVPNAVVTCYSSTGNGGWLMNSARAITKDYLPKYFIVRGQSVTSVDWKLNAHVVGKWK